MGSGIEPYVPKLQAVLPDDISIRPKFEAQFKGGYWNNVVTEGPRTLESARVPDQGVRYTLSQAANHIGNAVRFATEVKGPTDLFLPLKMQQQLGRMQDVIVKRTILPHVAKLQQRAHGVSLSDSNTTVDNGTPVSDDAPVTTGEVLATKGMTSAEKFFWGVFLGSAAGVYTRFDNTKTLAAIGGGTYGGIATYWTDEAKGKWDSLATARKEVDPSDYVFNAGSSALFAAVLAKSQSGLQRGLQKVTGGRLTDDVALVSVRSAAWGLENAAVQWVANGEVNARRAVMTGVGGGFMTYAKPLGTSVGLPLDKYPMLVSVPVTAIASLVKLVEEKLASFGPKNQRVELGPSGDHPSEELKAPTPPESSDNDIEHLDEELIKARTANSESDV